VTPVPDVALSELAAFVIVCEEASFTRAGRRLHLSQPGVSGRIMRLERALGVRLLDRTTRSVELTAAGRELLPIARTAVGALTEVRARMADAAAPPLASLHGRPAHQAPGRPRAALVT
jgi:DNA-binding transcriptional LysR family regulator